MTDPKGGVFSRDHYDARGFWALIVTQFQGAFNDNLYKFLIIYTLMDMYRDRGEHYLILGRFEPDSFVPAFATLMFSLPFILFPALFGSLSDRFSKQRVALSVKYLEMFIMALGGLAFWWAHVPLIWAVLFLMSMHSALFSPAKYGILPEILPESRLSAANGILQMGTIVAIIAGTGLAGPIYAHFKGHIYWGAGVLMLFSACGLVMAHFITRPPAANPAQRIPWNPWDGTGPYFRVIWQERVLLNVVIGYTYFWFAGALLQQTLITFTETTLGYAGNTTLISGLQACLALGIGIGAVSAGYLSRGKIETGLVPLCAAGMALFCLLLAIHKEWYEALILSPLFGAPATLLPGQAPGATPYYCFLLFASFGLGFFAGGFDVPLAAKVQQLAPGNMKGGIIAATNVLTFLGTAASGLLFLGFAQMKLTPYHIFLVTAALSAGIGLYISVRLPILLVRAGLWLLDGTLFRLRVHGRENLPEHGPALLVGNHGSFIESLVLLSAIDREVHFVMRDDIFRSPLMGRIARVMHIIPVPCKASAEDLLNVMQQMREVFQHGGIVIINREKFIEPDGLPLPWFDDYRKIAGDALEVPVIPMSQTRMWEVMFDFEGDKIIWHRLGWIRFPLFVWIGAAVPKDADGWTVRDAVARLDTDAHRSKPYMFTQLHRGQIKVARRNIFHQAMVDGMTPPMSQFKVLVGTLIFARKFAPILRGQEAVGLLVPSTVGGALANLALTMLGKTPVNLNYTTSAATVRSCAERCGITHIITARAFLERIPIEVPGTPVFLEDIKKSITGGDKIWALVSALLSPIWLIERTLGTTVHSENDPATVIFSSGSEGDPKGIVLTHRNIISQVETATEDFPHQRTSCIVGFLPFFHSMGYTASIWFPLLAPLGVIYHPNPLEPKVIGGLIEKFKGTHLIATATFLQGFMRRCTPEQMASLQFVVTGAEKLPERIRVAFKNMFGVEPMEGYGTTELAPIVSLNHPDRVSPGFYLAGVRHGTIGRPIPGQSIRTVDPDTGEFLPRGETGLLYVKGPNVMSGYLNEPERTAKVMKEGWYCTGDMGFVSDDGFTTITGRLARFSKIAGEMVPHARLEEQFHGMLGLTEQSLALAGIPDLQKGERLAVLHILEPDQLEELLKQIDDSDLPNLWRPRPSSFHRIEAIPVLGTGKMDIKKVKEMALAIEAAAESAK